MSGKFAALLVGIAALTFVSTIAEARDGCGRGMYYNGRRCVPQDDYDRDYRYRRDDYDRDYRYRRREPGVGVDLGPNMQLRFGDRPRPRYDYDCRYTGDC
jgi:hypothetical protein